MPRIRSLDLARGFTVLAIAPVHTVMLYSKLSVRDTLMGKLLAFIAEGPGAQLFMLLMGLFFALALAGRPGKPFLNMYKRVFYLFHGAIALNILKFVIPHFLGLLPESLLNDLQIAPGFRGYIQLALIGDILQFAALATLALFLVSRLPHAHFFSLILASLICLFAPLGWDLHAHNASLDYLLQLMGGQPPQVFFPVLPWLVYPLVGFAIGIRLKNPKAQQYIFRVCRGLGWLLLIVGSVVKYYTPEKTASSFYRTSYYDTMIHLGIVLVTLSVWEWIDRNVRDNHFFDILGYASRNITVIYLIQWPLICWMLPLFGYQRLDIAGSLLAMAITSFMTLSLSFFRMPETKNESRAGE